MYEVGQEILDGKAVIVDVDANNLILSVSFPSIHAADQQPLSVTYSFGVTETFVLNVLMMLP